MQTTISAADKDLNRVFSNLVKFATIMIYQYVMAAKKTKRDATFGTRDVYGNKV